MSPDDKSKKKQDAFDALSAMASGEEPAPPEAPAIPKVPPRPDRPTTPPPVTPRARPTPAKAVDKATPARARTAGKAKAPAAPGSSKPPSRAAMAAQRRKEASQRKAETFRQTLIPILLTVGVLLVVVAIVGLASIPDNVGDDEVDTTNWDDETNPFLAKEWVKWLLIAALPVALILEFGAVIFILQSQRYKRLLAQEP